MRKLSSLTTGLACAIGLAAGACDDPPTRDDEPRGGWDGNSGNFNGNLGSFGTVSGLRGIPGWARDPTGPGTLNNAVLYGLRYEPSLAQSPCARATAGVTDVRFLSSRSDGINATGPDVEVERTGGGAARLALGETIVFPGRVYDGYMTSIEVMFEAQRVDTLEYRNEPGYEWPVFALKLCETGNPSANLDNPAWKHLGFVSWAPFVTLPELDGQPFGFHPGIVQAVTTIPRVEYRNNPNVPTVVAAQTGALLFKFAFFSGSPVALHGESDLHLRSQFGQAIPNAEFLLRGAMALGNASWVTLPTTEDAQQHRFLSFFTRDGTEVALFSLARGDNASAGVVHKPLAWGGGALEALRLTPDETTADAARSLDNVQAVLTGSLPGGQQLASKPTHAYSGPSMFRSGRYLSSRNNRKLWFYGLLRSNVAATNVGAIQGRIASQPVLENQLRPAAGALAYIVAAQSPLPQDTAAFEQEGNIEDAPPGAPVNPPITTDAGVDAAMIDAAMIDAMPDAAMLDARIDAMIDAGADATIDAGADAMIDAGADATPDASEDASVDAGPPVDGDVSCTPCDGGGPG